MRRVFAGVLFVLVTVGFAAGQQIDLSNPQQAVSTQTAREVAYYAGPGVVAPEVVPFTLNQLATGHCKKLDGAAVFSAAIDATGTPRNIYFLRPIGNDLDKIALNLIDAERFKPGTHDGAPSGTVVSIKVNLEACIEKEKNEIGQKVAMIRLRSIPDQKVELQQPPSKDATLMLADRLLSQLDSGNVAPFKVGGGISAPVLLKSGEAVYSDKARAERINGKCLISLIVDAHGMPQNLVVTKSLEPSLDQNALYAVSQYRFKPAMRKDSIAVPVKITVEVEYRLY